jgi:hypothetical protein
VKKNEADQPLGKTLPLFEYTDSTIVMHSEREKHFWATVKAPKLIPKARKPWVESTRKEGVVYTGDPVSKLLPKFGKMMTQLLNNREIFTVKEFAAYFHLRQDRRKAIVKQVKGLSMEDPQHGRSTA